MEAIARGDVDSAPITDQQRLLLRFVEKVTRHAYRITAEDSDQLRQAGWSDTQIAESVYVAALFALFNRVADAFGLTDPGYRALVAEGTPPPAPAERGK